MTMVTRWDLYLYDCVLHAVMVILCHLHLAPFQTQPEHFVSLSWHTMTGSAVDFGGLRSRMLLHSAPLPPLAPRTAALWV
jgi:hypothetical protein